MAAISVNGPEVVEGTLGSDSMWNILGDLTRLLFFYFFPPKLEVIASRTNYGPYKYGHGRDDAYLVRLKFKLTNEDQQPVLVKNLRVSSNDKSLDLIHNRGASPVGILTPKGWDYPAPDEQIYWGPFTLGAASVVERLAFFILPEWPQDDIAPIDFTGAITFSRRKQQKFKFTANR